MTPSKTKSDFQKSSPAGCFFLLTMPREIPKNANQTLNIFRQSCYTALKCESFRFKALNILPSGSPKGMIP